MKFNKFIEYLQESNNNNFAKLKSALNSKGLKFQIKKDKSSKVSYLEFADSNGEIWEIWAPDWSANGVGVLTYAKMTPGAENFSLLFNSFDLDMSYFKSVATIEDFTKFPSEIKTDEMGKYFDNQSERDTHIHNAKYVKKGSKTKAVKLWLYNDKYSIYYKAYDQLEKEGSLTDILDFIDKEFS